jgi:hypothetical protein
VDTWYGKHVGVASYSGRLTVSIYGQANTAWKGTTLRIDGGIEEMVEVWKVTSKLFVAPVPNTFAVTLPQWLAVSTLFLVSIAPRLPFKRFSLRTLLIATAIVAVVLGAIIYAVR